jgi:hypothetical protein
MQSVSEELAELACEGCKSYAISLLEMKKIGAGYWQMRARDSTVICRNAMKLNAKMIEGLRIPRSVLF